MMFIIKNKTRQLHKYLLVVAQHIIITRDGCGHDIPLPSITCLTKHHIFFHLNAIQPSIPVL